jgi:Ca2+-binding EF-hand superfamily protein
MGVNLSNRNVQTLISGYSKDDGIDALQFIADLKKSQTLTQTISSQPTNCSAELAELVRELNTRRQTLREVLAPYDRRNAGRVTPANFYRAFGETPTTRTIAHAYANGDEVDYTRLGNDLRIAQQALRSSTAELPTATPGFIALATLVKTRRIDARAIFSQKDPLNVGKISLVQFMAILSFLDSKLTPNTIQEIARPFQTTDREVNYVRFLEAIDSFTPALPRAPEPSSDDVAKLAKLQDPNFLLQKAKETIETRRIDVDLHFAALAREGVGDEVSVARFSRVIVGMRIDFRPDEIEAIASLFQGELGRVRYKDFVAAVKPAPAAQEVTATAVVSRLRSFLATSFVTLAQSASRFDREQSGVISAQQFSSALQFLKFPISSQDLAAIRDAYPGPSRGSINWRVLCAEVDREAPPEPAPEPISAVARPLPPDGIGDRISKISTAATFAGLDLAAQLRAADPNRTGSIAQDAFLRVLNKLPTQLAITEIRPLVAFYRVSGSSDVNYRNFLLDIASVAEKPAPAPVQLPQVTQTLPTLSPAVHGFLKRYKSFCTQRRITPTDPFVPYDVPTSGSLSSRSRVSSGLIPLGKLFAVFANLQFEIQTGDIDALQAAFRDSKRADLFNYAAFIRALKVEDIASEESRASLASLPVPPAVDQAAKLTAGQIREKLLARHRKIDVAFAGITEDTVSITDFQRRLAAIDLVLIAGQTQALIKKYRVNLTDQIDWRAFVADVNQSKTVGE